jgi:hypothetical protein
MRRVPHSLGGEDELMTVIKGKEIPMRLVGFSGLPSRAAALVLATMLVCVVSASAEPVRPPPRPAPVQRPAPRPVVSRPVPSAQPRLVQHNVPEPNAARRPPPPPNVVRPVNPNFNPNAGFAPNRGNPQPFNNQRQFSNPQPLNNPQQPFGGQQRIVPGGPQPGVLPPGPGGAPHAIVGGPAVINGLRPGPGRPGIPPGGLAPGPGGLPGGFVRRPPSFPVVSVQNRFFPIVRGPRYVWWGGYRRAFVPLAVLGIAAIGGSYWYPDGYVSVAQPYCSGVTPDGCQLTWRMVDFEDGGSAPQCVQYCPQVGPPPAPAQVASLPPPPPPPPANGSCQMTIFADPNFAGAAAPTVENQALLGEAGWLNEISSVQVQSGVWEFYADENFGGVSMRLQPGDYPNLAPEWTKHIGSFQCVEPTA